MWHYANRQRVMTEKHFGRKLNNRQYCRQKSYFEKIVYCIRCIFFAVALLYAAAVGFYLIILDQAGNITQPTFQRQINVVSTL